MAGHLLFEELQGCRLECFVPPSRPCPGPGLQARKRERICQSSC